MSEPSKSSHAQMGRALPSGPSLHQMPPANAKCLIVGFDFGTTFSGVSWGILDPYDRRLDETKIRTVNGWPSPNGDEQSQSKVKSRMIYNAQGQPTGWGCQPAGDGDIVLEWFKLAIVPEKDLPHYLRNSHKLKQVRQQMRKLGVTPNQVIEEYIRRIWTHAKGEIKNTIGQRAFESMPIHVVFTVPAIWDKLQTDAMQLAASTSILQSDEGTQGPALNTSFAIISEPEAAVQAYARELRDTVHIGEILLVIDLGGGTGDSISYVKTGQGENYCMALEEAAPGDGALCGAIFLDAAFEKLLLSRLPARHKNLKTENPAAWRRILQQQWEQDLKRTFRRSAKGDKIYYIILSDITADVDRVRLHEDEIRDVFESSVMPGIIDLVHQQIEKVKKANGGKGPGTVLPVGGFGRCPYVIQRLREEFQGVSFAAKSTKKGGQKKQTVDVQKIEVRSDTSPVPWESISRGACLSGLRARLDMSLVKSRVSRTNVMYIQNAPLEEEDGGVWSEIFGRWIDPNKLACSVRKGDSIETGDKSQKAVFLAFDIMAEGIYTHRAVFYAHDGDSPPARYDPNDARFREYGVMDIKVPKPIEKLRIEVKDGWERRVYDYQLHKQMVGGPVQVTAIDPDTRKVVGKLVLDDLDTA